MPWLYTSFNENNLQILQQLKNARTGGDFEDVLLGLHRLILLLGCHGVVPNHGGGRARVGGGQLGDLGGAGVCRTVLR